MPLVCDVQLDPQEAQIAALKRELFLLRQENVWLRDQVHMMVTITIILKILTTLNIDKHPFFVLRTRIGTEVRLVLGSAAWTRYVCKVKKLHGLDQQCQP